MDFKSYGGYAFFYIVLSLAIDATFPLSWLDALCRHEMGKKHDIKLTDSGREVMRKQKKIQARTSIVATVMAIHVSVLSLYGLLFGPTLDFFSETPLTRHLVNVAVGFFVWDVLFCWNQGIVFLAHGLACLAVFLMALSPYFHGMALVTLLFEASTPFLHARKALIDCDLAKGRLFVFTEYGFVAVFFLTRIAHGLYACVVWWLKVEAAIATGDIREWETPIARMYQSMCLLLSGLNCYWFFLMARAIIVVKENKSKKFQTEKNPILSQPKK